MYKTNLKKSIQKDPYIEDIKVLFVGWAHSSHTHSWIETLLDDKLNIRLFGLPDHLPHQTALPLATAIYP